MPDDGKVGSRERGSPELCHSVSVMDPISTQHL